MGTRHFFKNVRMPAMALTLCAAFAATTLMGCKKDEPWAEDVTLDMSYDIDTTTMHFTVLNLFCRYSVSESQFLPGKQYFVIDTLPECMNGKQYSMADIKWSTTDKRNAEPVRIVHRADKAVRYYIKAVACKRGDTGTYLTSQTMTYDAPVCTELVVTPSVSDITAHSVKVTINFSKSVTDKDLVMNQGDTTYYRAYIGPFWGVVEKIELPEFEGTSVVMNVEGLEENTSYCFRVAYGQNGKYTSSESVPFMTLAN